MCIYICFICVFFYLYARFKLIPFFFLQLNCIETRSWIMPSPQPSTNPSPSTQRKEDRPTRIGGLQFLCQDATRCGALLLASWQIAGEGILRRTWKIFTKAMDSFLGGRDSLGAESFLKFLLGVKVFSSSEIVCKRRGLCVIYFSTHRKIPDKLDLWLEHH